MCWSPQQVLMVRSTLSGQTCNCDHTRVIIEVEECTIVQMQNNDQSSYMYRVFLATLVALHFTPVSESVSEWAEFRTSVASRLASLFHLSV